MNPESPTLDFAADDTLTGFRLHRLEVYNWGTFHNRVWTLHSAGQNCLLTGDIGSGKSTLVDAITTLLVPPNRIAYNKAAGAEFKERNLRSYVLGYHRTERSESGIGSARPVGLRDVNTFTVLLARFHNSGYDTTMSLACVLWMKDPHGQPARFYVGAEKPLTIAEDFSNFDADIAKLRRRLKASQATVFDSFAEYSAWFRRRFGIENEQALDLFHQTVSMKSVGNLTDFVREHMLEPFDVQSRITALIQHFDDLDRAHAAVLRAKRQVTLLEPIVSDCDRYEAVRAESEGLRLLRSLLQPYFAELKQDLLNERKATLESDLQRLRDRDRALGEKLTTSRGDEADLRRQIAENGGDRIATLTARIESLGTERDRRRSRWERYRTILQELDESDPTNETEFIAQQDRLREQRVGRDAQLVVLDNRMTEDQVALHRLQEEHKILHTEIESLKARRSNIPASHIGLREALCSALSVSTEKMPFAGELLQVHPEAVAWEGAAERLLHAFGMSLLVPDTHYRDVVDWVDRTHLRGRLVYYRVRTDRHDPLGDPHPDSILRKVSILPDSEFYSWMEQEMYRRFDIACCETQEQFRREIRAVTRAGQIKMPGERHEKDDRHRLDDRSRYILGWNNKAKIEALEQQKRQVEVQGAAVAARLAKTDAERKALRTQLNSLSKLEEYRGYTELDWRTVVGEIAVLEEERRQLEATSDVLRQLNERLRQLQQDIKFQEEARAELNRKIGATEDRLRDIEQQFRATAELLVQAGADLLDPSRESLRTLCGEVLGEKRVSLEGCDAREREVREALQSRIDSREKTLGNIRDRLIQRMGDFRREFEAETREFDASLESAGEFRALLARLNDDDLPRFEKRFKELLNQNTIREIAGFSAHLNQQRQTILDRVHRINQSLVEIDYNPDRYIVLEAAPVPEADLREFQNDLRACTEGSLTGSEEDVYSEQKFLQVQRIIERFRGREGQTEQDRRWTRKVTDVRNWFAFAASERWRQDHSEHEHYSDSGGKSGGQKEKLAYTILAASLAYQFGLEWGRVRSRSFRFVVIDEAFGRGSDESAQYGLRLFQKLNLQLLIVTPLQKIHIIEPFVASMGFVHNVEGKDSRLRNLTIEAYREEKARLAE